MKDFVLWHTVKEEMHSILISGIFQSLILESKVCYRLFKAHCNSSIKLHKFVNFTPPKRERRHICAAKPNDTTYNIKPNVSHRKDLCKSNENIMYKIVNKNLHLYINQTIKLSA